MKYTHLRISFSKVLQALALVVAFTSSASAEVIRLYYDAAVPQIAFAVGDIKAALEKQQHMVETKDLAALSKAGAGRKVVVAIATDKAVASALAAAGCKPAVDLGEQAYTIRSTPDLSYWVQGGDANGAMYGALQIAEDITFKGTSEAFNEDDTPHLKNRGIKFNIPLDKEAPTYFYDSRGTANRLAIPHVWDITFWKTWFDEMARHRYNVLSLWNPHPFTSMVNMEAEYPGIAINGVTGFDKEGNEIPINDWSIDRKIEFWREVMNYGHERGFRTFVFTWNIFLSTAEGKHGIGEGPQNQATRKYIRQCTTKLLETYPQLAGIGVTVGENMDTKDDELKEDWAWDTYGRGTLDYARAHPERQIGFIHRLHEGTLQSMAKAFQPLIDQPNVRFEFSHKYSNAHMHAAVQPGYWARKNLEPQLEQLGLTSWLTVRNDDWFYLHWADPQFARDYVNHFPQVGKYVNGIYIGPDGWVFSRVFQSKDPSFEEHETLDVQRTWYMQKIWGRIAYNPKVSDDLFKSHLTLRYPEVASSALFEAWSKASRAVTLMNEQVTGKWSLDFHWWPERWTHKDDGYRTLSDLIETRPMEGSNLADVKRSASGDLGGRKSALLNADEIEQLANEAQQLIVTFKPGANHELDLNLRDLEAMTSLAFFGASKLRAAVLLEQKKSTEAIALMLTAYRHWTKYAEIMDANYIGADMQRNYHFQTWHQLDAEILREIASLGGPETVDLAKPYPWVRIVTPKDQTEVMQSGDFTVSVNAGAGDSPVTKVELRSNGELVATASEQPHTFAIKGMKTGEHKLSAKVFDSRGGTSEHSVVVTLFNTDTKNDLPWKEEFTHADHTTTDNGRTTWTAARPGGVCEVRDNALFINDKGGEGLFRTGEINIASSPVNISLDITSQGGVDKADYVRLYRVLDGGKEELIGEVKGNESSPATIKGTASGKKLVLVIRAKVSSEDEVFRMDNLQVGPR